MTVYTGGTFDVFHSGHANFLRQCALLGKVTVALNTDEFVERYKGKKPLMSYQEREAVLLACRYVSHVTPNVGGSDSKPTVEAVFDVEYPDRRIIAVGTDWVAKDYYKQMGFTQEWLDELKIVLVYIAYTPGVTTTELKKRLDAS